MRCSAVFSSRTVYSSSICISFPYFNLHCWSQTSKNHWACKTTDCKDESVLENFELNRKENAGFKMENCTHELTCSLKGINQSEAFLQSTLLDNMDRDIKKEPWALWGLYLLCMYFVTHPFASYSGSPGDRLFSFPLLAVRKWPLISLYSV